MLISRQSIGFLCGILLSASIFNGCSQTCNIPTERSPALRIVNAMADQPSVDITLNGRTINPSYPYVLQTWFGYNGAYADQSLLHTGIKQRLRILPIGDTTALLDTTIALNDHRHTMILLGKKGQPKLTKVLLFDDEIDQRDPKQNLIRYVDAVPDLPAMDVYFQKTFTGFTPDFQLHYGDSLGYRPLNAAPGLTITATGDTNDVIFQLPISLQSTLGFFATIILRGEKHPSGSEPIVGTEVLSDQLPGAPIFLIQTFGMRFVNATRLPSLNLMPKGPSDQGARVDIAGQKSILNLGSDSVSDWAPFNPDYHGITANGAVRWYFGFFNGPNLDSLYSYLFKPYPNIRYTAIAMDDAVLGQAEILDSMILTDTIAAPPTGISRLRIVNLSPDHNFSFTLGGKLFTMPHRDIVLVDLQAGAQSFQLFDAKNLSTPLETVSFTLPGGVPKTLFFMPDNVANQVPYKIGAE